MIRLILLTLVGLFGAFILWGEPGARDAQRATDAEVAASSEPASPEATEAEEEAVDDSAVSAETAEPIVAAEAQTPEQVQDYPGPPLRPSPEHEGEGEEAVADLAPANAGAVLYVTGTRVNFRAGPSTNDAVIGALNGGSPVEALGEPSGGWINIRDAQGRTGYMSADFLSAERPN
ncbi:SH3 domain-containing protein [Paracoccus sp. TK19116]|uniref:SH3 domain-containing protein n=1 Tax=Paracoccus albicereus TaxID=2922394 RepID=A0ABT1MVF9_9RHOB|nr:SH3 domain-containing protein [Paracoccus albicereus]MCQ0972191.1 SH3 domain-containing protein [Paracoccus albicereus]